MAIIDRCFVDGTLMVIIPMVTRLKIIGRYSRIEMRTYSEKVIQHYMKKFVSDLRQVGGSLLFPPPIKLTVESGVKHHRPTEKLIPSDRELFFSISYKHRHLCYIFNYPQSLASFFIIISSSLFSISCFHYLFPFFLSLTFRCAHPCVTILK